MRPLTKSDRVHLGGLCLMAALCLVVIPTLPTLVGCLAALIAVLAVREVSR